MAAVRRLSLVRPMPVPRLDQPTRWIIARRTTTVLNHMRRFARAMFAGFRRSRKSGAAELWCRPATVLVLRDRARAPSCLAGWR